MRQVHAWLGCGVKGRRFRLQDMITHLVPYRFETPKGLLDLSPYVFESAQSELVVEFDGPERATTLAGWAQELHVQFDQSLDLGGQARVSQPRPITWLQAPALRSQLQLWVSKATVDLGQLLGRGDGRWIRMHVTRTQQDDRLPPWTLDDLLDPGRWAAQDLESLPAAALGESWHEVGGYSLALPSCFSSVTTRVWVDGSRDLELCAALDCHASPDSLLHSARARFSSDDYQVGAVHGQTFVRPGFSAQISGYDVQDRLCQRPALWAMSCEIAPEDKDQPRLMLEGHIEQSEKPQLLGIIKQVLATCKCG